MLVAAAGTLYFNATHVPTPVRPLALVLRDGLDGDGRGVAGGDACGRLGGFGGGVAAIAAGRGGAHGRDGGRGHQVRVAGCGVG
jgi:hypothetical protein